MNKYTKEELAAKHVELFKSYDKLYATQDGQVFPGTAQGYADGLAYATGKRVELWTLEPGKASAKQAPKEEPASEAKEISGSAAVNTKQAAKVIASLQTVEEVNAYIAGDTRKTIIDAASQRINALA